MATDPRSIIISKATDDTYSVRVEPAVGGLFDFDLSGQTQGYAATFARSLARRHGWQLVDLTGGANG